MWGDEYTKTRQCWNSLLTMQSSQAHWMHDKAHDEQVMDSMAGLVRPRSTMHVRSLGVGIL